MTVRFFAMQRVQTGKRSHVLELPEGADVAAAWHALVSELPELAAAAATLRYARNGVYVAADESLVDGDELALIPPVAGGAARRPRRPSEAAEAPPRQRRGRRPRLRSDAVAASPRQLEIRESALDDALIGELRRSVATSADGAVAIFVGQTRISPGTPAPGQEAEAARFAGQTVEGLSYEAFEAMALSVLAAIADEIEARFEVRHLAIVHRVGEVAVGETSVVIAAAAPHRDDAFAACRYAIEELKARAPIWKAERFADGSVWLGAPAREGPEGPADDG